MRLKPYFYTTHKGHHYSGTSERTKGTLGSIAIVWHQSPSHELKLTVTYVLVTFTRGLMFHFFIINAEKMQKMMQKHSGKTNTLAALGLITSSSVLSMYYFSNANGSSRVSLVWRLSLSWRVLLSKVPL